MNPGVTMVTSYNSNSVDHSVQESCHVNPGVTMVTSYNSKSVDQSVQESCYVNPLCYYVNQLQ